MRERREERQIKRGRMREGGRVEGEADCFSHLWCIVRANLQSPSHAQALLHFYSNNHGDRWGQSRIILMFSVCLWWLNNPESNLARIWHKRSLVLKEEQLGFRCSEVKGRGQCVQDSHGLASWM